MARRSPGAVRARLPRRSRRYRYTIPGLSPSVHRQIQDVELDAGLSLGEIAEAYLRYRSLALGPRRRNWIADWTPDQDYDWRVDHDDARCLLELALRNLRPRARRELQALIRPLDQAYEARSLPNPFASADVP